MLSNQALMEVIVKERIQAILQQAEQERMIRNAEATYRKWEWLPSMAPVIGSLLVLWLNF